MNEIAIRFMAWPNRWWTISRASGSGPQPGLARESGYQYCPAKPIGLTSGQLLDRLSPERRWLQEPDRPGMIERCGLARIGFLSRKARNPAVDRWEIQHGSAQWPIGKLPLVIHVKDWGPISLNKTCRYCSRCDLLIAHKDEPCPKLPTSGWSRT